MRRPALAGLVGLLGLVGAAAPGIAADPPRCDPADLQASRIAIEALNAEFAYRIDHENGAGVAEMFVEDGSYTAPGQDLRGRAAIASAYRVRAARGERTSRHIFTNLFLRPGPDDTVEGTTIMLLFAEDGAPPHPARPLSLADFKDVYVCGADGKWRYRSRRVVPLFEDPQRQPLLLKAK